MSKKYFDEDGNEVQDILTKEEAEALAEQKKKEAEDAAAKKLSDVEEDHRKHLAKKTDEIVRLKDLTEEQKSKLSSKDLEDMKRSEAALNEAEAAKKEVEEMKGRELDSNKNRALDELGIYDPEERKKAILGYDRILGDMKTYDEVRTKMSESINMQGLRAQAHAGFRAPGSTGAFPTSGMGGGEKRYSDTPEGKELARKLNMRYVKDEDNKK